MRRPLWVLLVRMGRTSPGVAFSGLPTIQKLDRTWLPGWRLRVSFDVEEVPRHLVINNFPIAVAGANPRHPRLTPNFQEYSRYRGFTIGPVQAVRSHDNSRVEHGIPYLREYFIRQAA